ncbi:3-oxo-5-alpha-steroid 4-dehydrogenase-domain-containing protein [Aspergillus pseudotamarii]|uniref:3-oxo-5-alpha-steroid 4-dehydrogenase-domain-containing protein n=1 Tax=Aspergillus pseudotamarii TaxID=132259 RepID=A0A5N6T638_ASPPS|nr:3-oxo-5-alpha-steroid 4-dehydrogenase-domain-containing protein [Aspergillus pseudotamarii]KAE8141772.1 3-oxo-5-alpha-steroid 4-dehydrogenase-domain-containing protein [Aspergillus pseudotamarii]
MTPVRITVVIRPRGGSIKSLPHQVRIGRHASTEELYDALARSSGLSIYRLRITHESDCTLVPNSKEITIEGAGVEDMDVVTVKDLGPQISWRAVYIAEYLGPVFIPWLFLFPLRPYLDSHYDTTTEPSSLQLLLCALLTVHFVKREYESIFVHRFSNATMPARKIVQNSGYYCVMSCNMAYWIFRPDAAAAAKELISPWLLYTGLGLFAFGELANLNTHLVLRDIRRSGTTERGVPCGFGFGVVTCPNYFFEIIAWIGIYFVSGLSWSILFFIIIGSVQMAIWAKKKERRYRQGFGAKYKFKRFVMLPGII